MTQLNRRNTTAVNYDGNNVAYGSVDLAVRYMFFKQQNMGGMLSVGYRYVPMTLDVTYEGSAFKADLNFSAPYLGLRFAY